MSNYMPMYNGLLNSIGRIRALRWKKEYKPNHHWIEVESWYFLFGIDLLNFMDADLYRKD